jgi:AcrR family transcriptional regulator
MSKDNTSKHRHYVKTPPGDRWVATLEAHRQAQRDQILDGALDLLTEGGIAGLTMAALAERAGVSRATLYHYFPSIDHVLAAWVGREVRTTVDQLVARANEISDPQERLRWLIEAQVRTFAGQEHRLSVEHLESEAGSPEVRRAVSSGLEPLRELFATTLVEAGARHMLPQGFPPQAAGDLVLGILGALRRHVVAGHLEPNQAVEAAWGLLAKGWLSNEARAKKQGTPSPRKMGPGPSRSSKQGE